MINQRSKSFFISGAVLTIEPGVEMEFYPSVGILVLGTMHAQGNLEKNIIMRPVELQNVHDYRLGRQLVKNAGNPTKITKDKSSSKSKYDPAKRKQRSVSSMSIRFFKFVFFKHVKYTFSL